MSRNQRILLVVAAVAVAVVAFLLLNPGGDDEPTSAETTVETVTETTESTPTETETTESTPTETATVEPGTSTTRIQIQGGQVVGGPKTIEVTTDEQVRIVVSSDQGDELHLHGYDITKEVAPGGSVTFNFEADLEGVFELESHVAEDAGQDPLVAKLVVNPS
jgi:hypothetical protein